MVLAPSVGGKREPPPRRLLDGAAVRLQTRARSDPAGRSV
ncbi:MAG: hypothetical protein AVDCRST_MAG64-3298 [uncultured Phycisphaerae bacterium]|uniref:Uncharacterized protein n=1 Tax=uncultured Phycisphaerae bacterium TaxID=904963 RepID=A0A6J4Q2D2_9BACT|nr:MAG: hypothetical protein AVDCRST_MAG64-3298 [uncultured Phycisphaerae bacterium]